MLETSNANLDSELLYQYDLVKQLRQSFLREAMQGKLVKQNPKDGNAKDLLEKIKAEKTKLGKKEKPLAEIKEEEIPFAIPSFEFCFSNLPCMASLKKDWRSCFSKSCW